MTLTLLQWNCICCLTLLPAAFWVLQFLVRAQGLTICKTMFLTFFTLNVNTDIKYIWLINCSNVKSLHNLFLRYDVIKMPILKKDSVTKILLQGPYDFTMWARTARGVTPKLN